MERYRVFWDVNFERLDAHLRRVQQAQDAATQSDTTTESDTTTQSDTTTEGTGL
jgi:hypothetical protein